MKTTYKSILLAITASVVVLAACQKDDYYNDGGLSGQSAADRNKSTYDFLVGNANHYFDSLVKIIDLTNSKALINQQNITVFAMTNSAVTRFQLRFVPDDRRQPRPLDKIGTDTLRKLLNRLIIPNAKVSLGKYDRNGVSYYKDNNGDSLLVYEISGITTPGSQVRTQADRLDYEHRKLPNTDTSNYRTGMQTHNLMTANAVVHVPQNGANFATGFKTPFIR